MDTQKMGSFIRELRKEQNMTQKDLAERLHLTDRAVSKWERGLNAPDLATLEPLAEALGVSLTELIAGERAEEKKEDLRAVIGYSVEQAKRRSRARRRCLGFALGIVALALVMVGSILWCKGVFSVAERSTSPDGEVTVTVYDRDIAQEPFSREQRVTVQTEYPGGEVSTAVYGGVFRGLWWSSKEELYILSLETEEGLRTVLERRDSTTNLDAWLRLAVGEAGMDFGGADTQYRFCQWAEAGQNMLIYYRSWEQEGYFWCDCGSGDISGLFHFPVDKRGEGV